MNADQANAEKSARLAAFDKAEVETAKWDGIDGRRVPCDRCNMKGWDAVAGDVSAVQTCPRCDGRGWLIASSAGGDAIGNDDRMASQPFSITVDAAGHGTLMIDGVDHTKGTRGIELSAFGGELTRLIVHTYGSGTVTGEGEVEYVSPTVNPADVAALVRSVPPSAISKEVDADLLNDLSSNPVQVIRDAIARILAR